MRMDNIRIVNVNMNNLKNVKKGNIQTRSYKEIKKHHTLEKGDMLGIYGPNGSGKSVVVEAFKILKYLLRGESLPKEVAEYIHQEEEVCILEFTFFIDLSGYKYFLFYTVEIERDEERKAAVVVKEKITVSPLKEGKWKQKTTLIDYDYRNKDMFKPVYRYNEIIGRNQEYYLKFRLYSTLAREKRTSFVFLEETRAALIQRLGDEHGFAALLEALIRFGRFNFYIVTDENRGKVDIGEIMSFHLFERFKIPEISYKTFISGLRQINDMLGALMPGLKLEVHTYDSNEMEFVAVQGKQRVFLRHESDGIKKLIAFLGVIAPLYQKSSMCFVIDDLDKGIFEYLVGELLEVMKEDIQGQFIFTGQSLRALEKLDKKSIVVTTTNPENKYIHLESMKHIKNLRDVYFKSIHLGWQKEKLYEGGDKAFIKAALIKASRTPEA